VPPTRRPRAHHRVNPYLGARRQNETNFFSDHDETNSVLIAANLPPVSVVISVSGGETACGGRVTARSHAGDQTTAAQVHDEVLICVGLRAQHRQNQAVRLQRLERHPQRKSTIKAHTAGP